MPQVSSSIFFRCLVLLDVEGLSCAKKQDDNYDLKLFTLAVLSSSVLIYNTKGTIEASALDTLHLAAKIGPEFMKDLPEKVSDFFPILVWAIRDQFLDLVVDGKSATPNEHMEDILKNEKIICKEIKKNFQHRECFAFPLPTKNFDQLKNLPNLSEHNLSKTFLKEINRLLKLIEEANPKTTHGEELDGKSFAIMFEDFCATILKRDVNIKGTYQLVETETNRDEFEKSISNFKTAFENATQHLPSMTL